MLVFRRAVCLALVGCAGLEPSGRSDAVDVATAEAMGRWGREVRAVESGEVSTETGSFATYTVFRTSGPADDSEAQALLADRESRFGEVATALVEGGADLRALEGALKVPGHFATVVVGPAGDVWSVSSGVPLPLAGADALAAFASGLGSGPCAPMAVHDVGVVFDCDGVDLTADSLVALSLELGGADAIQIDLVDAHEAPPPAGRLPPPAVVSRFPVAGSGWYHYPGSDYHKPNSGWYGADDTYALDLNKGASPASDCGEVVSAVAAGTVKEVIVSDGWVLVEHSGSITWLGQEYTKYYTGHGHMKNLAVGAGAAVTAGQKLGEVSLNGGGGSCHLHFAVYVGTWLSAVNNRMLYSIDPDTLGATYRNFDYTGRGFVQDNYVDERKSMGSYSFVKGGSGADWYTSSSYGVLGGMYYTRASTGSNTATWKFDDGAPATGSYRMYAFIPRNYATTTNARYTVYGGASATTVLGTATVSQLAYSDYWVSLGSFSYTRGHKAKVFLSDATGEATSKYVGIDIIRRWRKSDSRMDL